GGQSSKEDEELARKAAYQAIEEEALRKEIEQKIEENNMDSGSSSKEDNSNNPDDDISQAPENKDSSNKSSGKDEAPTINLKIYEGPTYSQADDIYYFRIEAIVTGNPEPSIIFSRDDSNGVWGNNKVQINLKKGATYTLTVIANNSAGKNTDSIKLDWDYVDTNQDPIIHNIKFDSDDFFPNLQYMVTSNVTDPDNDTIFYSWRTEGGFFNETEAATVIWTAPGTEGIYNIVLDVSDGWGGSDSITKTISVGAVPQNAPPVIQDIAVYPDGSKYTNNTYEIWCYASDPNHSIINYDFNITGGSLYNQSANLIKWDTPNDPGTYTVTVTVNDKEGNTVTSSKNIVVEQERVEITDIIVQINYIATSSSYYIKGVIIDPKLQINQYQWSTSGGDISDQVGYTAVWNTPHTPGTYNLTLIATTFGGDTITKTKGFVVNSPQ
ncbi:hypothetical protein ACFLQQ_04445, partial [Actinomycetota bacterium]